MTLKLFSIFSILSFLTLFFSPKASADPIAESDGKKLEHDFNADGFADLVTLEDSVASEYLTLKIYLTDDTPEQRLRFINKQLITALPSIASVPGTGTRLHLAKSGDLIIVSFNEAFGPERWNIQTKYSFKSGSFYLRQLSYRSRDILEGDDQYSCLLDFRSKRGVINGRKIKLRVGLNHLTLNELSADIIGSPHNWCEQLLHGSLPAGLAAYLKFKTSIPIIELASRGAMIQGVRVHTGDLNGDGRDDAVVSFALAREDDRLLGREAAVYLNRDGKSEMQVVTAMPRLSCGWSVESIAGGNINMEFNPCGKSVASETSSNSHNTRKFRLCDLASKKISVQEDSCK